MDFVSTQKCSLPDPLRQCATKANVDYQTAFVHQMVIALNIKNVSVVCGNSKPLFFIGKKPPGGLAPKDVPQFVVLTFDDAVNGRTLPDYLELFKTVKYR